MNPSMTDDQRNMNDRTADLASSAVASAGDLPTMDTQAVVPDATPNTVPYRFTPPAQK